MRGILRFAVATLRPPVAGAALALALAVAPAAGPAAAEPLAPVNEATGQPFTADEAAVIGQLFVYLNDLGTLQSSFVQLAPNGGVAEGTLWISRPGRMRVEYNPPVDMLLVATGIWFIYWDGELEEATYLPMDATPLTMLLDEDIEPGEDVVVTGLARADGLIRLGIVAGDDPSGEEGRLYLVFLEDPLEIRQWRVIDAQGQETRLALLDPRFDIEIDRRRFLFSEPQRETGDGGFRE